MLELTAEEGPEEDQGQWGPGGKEDGGVLGAVQGHNCEPGAGWGKGGGGWMAHQAKGSLSSLNI